MLRLHTLSSTAAIALAVMSSAGSAQDTPAVKSKLIQALTASAKGECAESIMSPLLLDACEQQMDAMRRLLAPLGNVREARFMGIQEMGNGLKAEAYRVAFERGSMMWIASLDGSGKLLVLWSNGQVRQL